MRKADLFMGLVALLWGTSAAIGQEGFSLAQCNPCGSVAIDPCGNGNGGFFTPFTFGGWIDMGVYANSHGNSSNGPMFTGSKKRTDLVMNQLYLSAAREMNTRRGFDWGAKADFVYGAHAGSMQNYGDETFDFGWGENRHGYAMSAYQLYGTLGYRDLSVIVGKFSGRVGWEASASKNNFFYSHSYCYWIEPATHSGVLATYDVSDRLSLSAGWTAGMDAGFQNRYNDSSLLSGFEYALTDNATIYYWINAGKMNNGFHRGEYRFDNNFAISHNDYFVQSLCLEWDLTKRFTYVLQYNLRNDNFAVNDGSKVRDSSYGINNHFLYKLNDRWGVGTRFEWLRDNGGYIIDNAGDYYQVTLGLNWNPRRNVSIRPEVRYDWCKGATPFAGGTRNHQFSGGGGVLVSF